MNRQEYMARLGAALADLVPAAERADSLRWYEEYFDEAGPEREAEVIRELGSPEELARKIAREGGYLNDLPTPRRRFSVWAIAALAAVVIVAGIGIQAAVQGGLRGNKTGRPVFPPATDAPVWSEGAQNSVMPGSAEMEFHSVSVEVDVADVTIVAEGNFDVLVNWDSSLNYSMSYEVVNGVLKVRSRGTGKRLDGGYSSEVIITVPEGTTLREVGVEVGLGDVMMMSAWAEEASLDTGLGDVIVEDAQVTGELDAATGLGDVTLNGPLAARTELESGMGDIWVYADSRAADCAYELDTGMGAVLVDGQDRGRSAHTRDGQYKLEASSGMGDVGVEFRG